MNIILLYFKNKFKNGSNPFLASILSHSPKYLGASLISAFVGMAMNKYYTAVFSPAEFGVLSLYITLFQYLQNFIGFSVDASAQRVYFDYKGKEREQFLGTVLFFLTASALSWSIISIFFQNLVIKTFGGTPLMYYVTVLLAVVFMYFNFLNRIGFNEHVSNLIFKQGLLQTFCNHFGSFLFIAFAKLGILGRQLAQLIAYLINIVFYQHSLKKLGYLKVKFVFRTDVLKRLSHFAIPAFFSSALTATFAYLDRIFLNYFHGAGEVGIYSLGYALGQGLSIVTEAVSMALFPSLMKELEQNYQVNIKKLKQFDLILCLGLVLIGIIVFMSRNFIIQLFSNNQYQNAANVLPFIVFAFILGGFYKTVANVLSFHNVVWFYPLLSVVSFGSSVVFNYLLIPKFHELGAAYSFLLGVLIYSLVIHIIGSKYYFKLSRVLAVYSAILVISTYSFARLAKII